MSQTSVQVFCRQKGLKEGLLYTWRRELRTRDAKTTGGAGFVELVGPVAVAGRMESGASIRIDDRVHLVLGRGGDPETLTTAVDHLLAVTSPLTVHGHSRARATFTAAGKVETAGP